MNLHRVAIFAVVYERRSFTRAAAELHMTQPAVSIQVRELENELGVPLFRREGRHLEPTEAGQILSGYAREVLARTGEVKRELKVWQGARTGRIALGSNRTLGGCVLPALLVRFWQQYPGARISLEIDHTDGIFARTLSGGVDLGFVADRPPMPELVGEQIMQDPLVLIAAAKPAAAGVPNGPSHIDRDTLLTLPLIMPRASSWYRLAITKMFNDAGLSPQTIMELDGVEPIKTAVESSVAVAFVPYSAAQREIRDGRLRVVTVEGLQLHIRFFLVYRRSKQFSPILQRFYEAVRHELGMGAEQAGGI